MLRPLVLITSIPRSVPTTLGVPMDNATVNQRFGWLVERAGGIPVAADAWVDPALLVERVEAIVINGGTDVSPELYGAERLSTSDQPDRRRDQFELGLIQGGRKRGIPILGICRGMQLLNVACGGSLFQRLPRIDGMLEHYVTEPYDRPVHAVAIEPDSALAQALGSRDAMVNTIHHQGIDRVGAGLRVTAMAPDGTIEGLEDDDGRSIGVQWHPEFLVGRPGEQQVGLFRRLVQSA